MGRLYAKQVGTYTVSYAQYGGKYYHFTSTAQFYDTQADIDSNMVTDYSITVNISTGVITIHQNY